MAPVSKLLLPPVALAGCVFAAVFRDTRGCGLASSDRFNHFPASPLWTVTHIISGDLEIRAPMSLSRRFGPTETVFLGPQITPVTSWSPADVTAVSVGIYPDAWQRLEGFSATIAEAIEIFSKVEDPEIAWEGVCDELGKIWHSRRAAPMPAVAGVSDWVRSALARSVANGRGQGVRAIERRLKKATGHTRRTLDFFAAFEGLQNVVQENKGDDLAQIADAAGYSDQSHMGRAVLRATGLTPARLNKAIETRESFWCYRLLGEKV